MRVSGNPVPHLSLIYSISHGVKDDPMLAMRARGGIVSPKSGGVPSKGLKCLALLALSPCVAM